MKDATTSPALRQLLYEEIWTEPLAAVAERYGISHVELTEICGALSIPLPTGNYWLKLRAGKRPSRAPLPPQPPAEPEAIRLKLPAKLAAGNRREKATPQVVDQNGEPKTTNEGLPTLKENSDSTQPTKRRTTEVEKSFHPIVKETIAFLRKAEPRFTHKKGGLLWAPDSVLNVAVTKQGLQRAAILVDSLIKALAEHSYSVEVSKKDEATYFVSPKGAKVQFSLRESVRKSKHEDTRSEQRARDLWHEALKNGIFMEMPNIAYSTQTSHLKLPQTCHP